MNPEKGMEIADCWKEFHPMVRAILKKATSKKAPKPPKSQNRKNPSRRTKEKY